MQYAYYACIQRVQGRLKLLREYRFTHIFSDTSNEYNADESSNFLKLSVFRKKKKLLVHSNVTFKLPP